MIGIILAAGQGSRLSNQEIPNKSLIKIGNDCIIDYNLKMLAKQNVRKIIIVVNHNRQAIMDYVGDFYLGIPIQYVFQKELKGVAHAVLCAKNLLDDDFIMCMEDEILINERLSEMIKYFYQENLFCLCGAYINNNDYSGKPLAYDLDSNNYIINVTEKAKSFSNEYRGIGECIFKKDTIELLNVLQENAIRKELEMGDWIQAVINKYKYVKLFNLADNCINVNYFEDIEYIKNLSINENISKYYDLVFIILNYNNYQLTIKAVKNVLSCDKYANIIIVDNASTNNAWEKLNNNFKNKENICLIRNSKNEGYARGNNFALNKLEELFPNVKYVAIMNPDIEIPSQNSINVLYQDIKNNPQIALLTGITNYNNQINNPNECAWDYPTKIELFLKGTLLGKLIRFENHDFNISNRKKEIEYVDVVQGCFFIADYSAFQSVGFFDRRPFIYYDENILAKKIDKLDKKKAVATNVVINHNHFEKSKELSDYKMESFHSDCYHDSRIIYINNFSEYSKLFCLFSTIFITIDKYLKRFFIFLLHNNKKPKEIIKDLFINYYPIIFVFLFLFINTFGFNPKLIIDMPSYASMVVPYIPMNITVACFIIALFGLGMSLYTKQIKFDLISLLLFIRIILYFVASLLVKEDNYKIGVFYAVIQSFFIYTICKNYKKDNKYFYLLLFIFTVFISCEIFYIPLKNKVNFFPTVDGKSKWYMTLPMGVHNYITCILIPIYLLLTNSFLKNKIIRFAYTLMIGLAVLVTSSRWGFLVFLLFTLLNYINDIKTIFLDKKYIRYLFVGVAMLVIACVIFWPFISPAITNILSRYSISIFSSRLQIFQESFEIFLKHPLLGRAAYSYSVYDANNAHNFILESLIQTGIIGTLVYFLCLILVIKKLNCIVDKKTRKGFILYIAAILFQGLAEPNMFGLRSDSMFWIVLTFGITLSINNFTNKDNKKL